MATNDDRVPALERLDARTLGRCALDAIRRAADADEQPDYQALQLRKAIHWLDEWARLAEERQRAADRARSTAP